MQMGLSQPSPSNSGSSSLAGTVRIIRSRGSVSRIPRLSTVKSLPPTATTVNCPCRSTVEPSSSNLTTSPTRRGGGTPARNTTIWDSFRSHHLRTPYLALKMKIVRTCPKPKRCSRGVGCKEETAHRPQVPCRPCLQTPLQKNVSGMLGY